jgi:hypothetical protein
MTLAIQQFLRDYSVIPIERSLELLAEKYGISAKSNTKYPNLFLFKYSQIDSPFDQEIVRECRGLVLDSTNNWNIVAFPFIKFFNKNEPNAATIDWKKSVVFEKLDGSLMILAAYNNEWFVSTSGSLCGEGSVGDYNFTFGELFWKSFKYKLPPTDINITFMFELTSIYNKIVVRHGSEPTITLLGARNNNTLQELTLEAAHEYFPDVPVVQSYPLASFDEITKSFDDERFAKLESEGYVICSVGDGLSFDRVKDKAPPYVYAHHLKDSLGSSRRALVECVRQNQCDEVISVLPEYEGVLLEAKSRLDALVLELEDVYAATKDIVEQKEFALRLESMKVKTRAPLFALRAGKTKSISHYFETVHIDSLLKLLDYKSSND